MMQVHPRESPIGQCVSLRRVASPPLSWTLIPPLLKAYHSPHLHRPQPFTPVPCAGIMTTTENITSPPTSPPAKRVKTTDETLASIPSHTVTPATTQPTMSSQAPALLIKKLSPAARLPTRGSAFAAGYDVYASKATSIPARGKALVDTDIAISVPAGTCASIRSAPLAGAQLTTSQTAASPPALASPPSTSSTRALASLMPTTAARSRSCCSTTPTPTLRWPRVTASPS